MTLSRSRFAACMTAVLLSAGLPAQAQEMRPMLTLAMAQTMADACMARQAEAGYRPVNIAVVDRGADLVLFHRQNDAFLGSGEIAIQKAGSAVRIPLSTRTIGEIVYGKDGNPGTMPGLAHSDVVAFAGGLPIRTSDGVLVGAVGVSGASADQHEDCAQAGLDAIAGQLN